jgi:LysM repeat protein
MTAGRSERGPIRIRRRGRHTTPSQVEKVAQQAGKAAPAVAISGALVVAPGASHALAASAKPVTATATIHTATAAGTDAAQPAAASLDSFATRTVTVAAAKPAKHAAVAQSTHYSVRSGDTLSSIAEKYYHQPNDWQYLFHENDKTVSNPNLIFAGEELTIPASVPANFTLTSYTPKHAAPTQAAPVQSAPVQSAPVQAEPMQPTTSVSETSSHSSGGAADVAASAAQGMYSCSSLEQLWEQAGGSSAAAFMAAEIAMAESSGNPNAISPTADYGLWQINASNGALATLNPFDNAKSAITLSDDGTNWGPWTTFTTGVYAGKC